MTQRRAIFWLYVFSVFVGWFCFTQYDANAEPQVVLSRRPTTQPKLYIRRVETVQRVFYSDGTASERTLAAGVVDLTEAK